MIKKLLHKNIKRGITLIELIIAMALVGIVIAVSAGMLIFGGNAHNLTFNQYKIQSQVRIAAEKVSNTVRYSKATFAVPYTFVENTSKMDKGWSYLMVSPDKKQIVSMESNGTDLHKPTVIVDAQKNIEYEMIFEKDTSAKSDNVMKYKIIAYAVDDKGTRLRKKIELESKVESVNAVQVADKGTSAAQSIALAYRNDGQTSGKGRNDIAYITIITDTSGSMAANPEGEYVTDWWGIIEHPDARIKNLREALVGRDGKEGIIQKFAKEENIYISLVPFSTTANTPNTIANLEPDKKHEIYELYKDDDENNAISKVNLFVANGGTNTGDALRRAYNLHKNFRSRIKDEYGYTIESTDEVHHYMILLVDGVTTFQTRKIFVQDVGKYKWRRRPRGYHWEPKFNCKVLNKFYIDDGNISFNERNKNFLFYYETDKTTKGYYNGYEAYGKKGEDKEVLGVYGSGNDDKDNKDLMRMEPNTVSMVGDAIKNFDDGINTYIIGYATGLSDEIRYIGNSIGTENKNIYKYDDKNFDLDEIFKDIANDIMADFWIATGPQIQ